MAIQVNPNEVGSLLAFLYRIRFDPAINQEFKSGNAAAVMQAFGLSPEETGLVTDLHDYHLQDADKAEKWAKLVACLIPEFYHWTYDVNPPAWW